MEQRHYKKILGEYEHKDIVHHAAPKFEESIAGENIDRIALFPAFGDTKVINQIQEYLAKTKEFIKKKKKARKKNIIKKIIAWVGGGVIGRAGATCPAK
jgi:hypothetical protein